MSRNSNRLCDTAQFRKKSRKFFEKGIDFTVQTRYNMKLYENDEKGVPINAQH